MKRLAGTPQNSPTKTSVTPRDGSKARRRSSIEPSELPAATREAERARARRARLATAQRSSTACWHGDMAPEFNADFRAECDPPPLTADDVEHRAERRPFYRADAPRRPPATPLGAIIRGYETVPPSHPPPGFEGRSMWKDGVYVGNRSGYTASAADEDPAFEG